MRDFNGVNIEIGDRVKFYDDICKVLDKTDILVAGFEGFGRVHVKLDPDTGYSASAWVNSWEIQVILEDPNRFLKELPV